MVKWLTHLAVNQTFVSSILIVRPIIEALVWYSKMYWTFFIFTWVQFLPLVRTHELWYTWKRFIGLLQFFLYKDLYVLSINYWTIIIINERLHELLNVYPNDWTMKDKAMMVNDIEAVIVILTNTNEIERMIVSLTSKVKR